MIISHTHRFIFFRNGKTGTTSIDKALQKYQEGEEYNISSIGLFYKAHVPPALVRSMLPKQIWSSYFKFSFVRNPWDWIASQWAYNFDVLPRLARRNHGIIKKIKNILDGQGNIYKPNPRTQVGVDEIDKL